MTAAGQLALDLGHRPALGRDDFLVAPSNADAVAWIDRWPDWSGPALVVFGPAGCGKTHLAQVWRARSGAEFVTPGAEPPGDGNYVVEDADDAEDIGLFHLFNHVAARGGNLLVTAREAPARWTGRLPDLTSRLKAAPNVAIAAPDDALISAVLIKLFADRQLRVGTEVVGYLATHMERSFDAARGIVAAADTAALERHGAITVPLVRDLLESGPRRP